MAFSEENNMVMPVSPMYGGGNGGGFGNFGGDGWWIILLLLLAGNGWGGGFGGGFGGGNALGYDFPWLLNGQNAINGNVNAGFQNAMLNDGITSIRDGINGVQNSLCSGFAGVNQAISSGLSQAEIAANARQMASMQQAFSLQSQLADCCCENRLANCQTQNIIQSEGSATRFADANNTRDIITSQSNGTRAILDKLCQLELDGVKAQVDAKNDRIAELQTQLNIANLAASQTAQTAQIQRGQVEATAALVNELRSCPVPSMPVYGMTPIFSCQNNNGGCGCGCGA